MGPLLSLETKVGLGVKPEGSLAWQEVRGMTEKPTALGLNPLLIGCVNFDITVAPEPWIFYL